VTRRFWAIVTVLCGLAVTALMLLALVAAAREFCQIGGL
jgi:cytochrome c-type biogenesis protein CcmE